MYGIIAHQKNSNLLQNVQIEAGRIITGIRRNSRTALYSELEWEPLYKERERQNLVLFYKIVYGIAPVYLQDLILPFIPPRHGYNLCNVGNFTFVIPQSRTVSYYNSFLPSTIQLWNNLPLETCFESFSSFKNVLTCKKQSVE